MFKIYNYNTPNVDALLFFRVIAISLLCFGVFNIMPKKLNLKGQTFSRLTVISDAIVLNHKTHFICSCSCGEDKMICGSALTTGQTTSCGCYQKERVSISSSTHGKCKTPEYYAWINMRTRCFNKNYKDFQDYGGRGITVCERWKDNFHNFLEDMGARPFEKYSLERIDVNGNYEPLNCKWADVYEQANNKRNIKYYECNGVRLNLQGWANYFGANQANVMARINTRGIDKVYEYYKKKCNGIFPNLNRPLAKVDGGRRCHKSKPIKFIDTFSNSTFIFKSIRDASKHTNIHHNTIRISAKSNLPYKGMVFEYI